MTFPSGPSPIPGLVWHSDRGYYGPNPFLDYWPSRWKIWCAVSYGGGNGTAGSGVVSRPGTQAECDSELGIIIGTVYDNGTGQTNGGSGWSLITNGSGGDTTITTVSWHKKMSATEPATITITPGEATYQSVAWIRIEGADVDGATNGVEFADVNKSNGTTVTWDGTTVDRDDSLHLAYHVGYNNGCNDPSGYTSNLSHDTVNELFSLAVDSGTLSNVTATKTSDHWLALSIVVQPPDAGGGATPTHHFFLAM